MPGDEPELPPEPSLAGVPDPGGDVLPPDESPVGAPDDTAPLRRRIAELENRLAAVEEHCFGKADSAR